MDPFLFLSILCLVIASLIRISEFVAKKFPHKPLRVTRPGEWYLDIGPSKSSHKAIDIMAKREPLTRFDYTDERLITTIKLGDPDFKEKLEDACQKATLDLIELNSTIEIHTPRGIR